MDDARRARADARRRRATLRKATLQSVEEDLSPLRGAEALSLVDRLTVECWSLAGRPLPTYRREEIPVRFVPRRLT
jgi:hypothetical protein